VTTLVIEDLHARVNDVEVLRGVDLTVGSGEVHALMGPNGSGKSTLSHVVMGREDYEVTGGSVRLDGTELLGLPTWRRAELGLFLAMQYPVAVPGVPVGALLSAAVTARGGATTDVDGAVAREATRLAVPDEFLTRGVNDEFSGGEQKRMETLQLAVLAPRIALLDELDSGLDVDALRELAHRVVTLTRDAGLGVLAITHYARLLRELPPDGCTSSWRGGWSPAAAPSWPSASRPSATRVSPPSSASRTSPCGPPSPRTPSPTPASDRVSGRGPGRGRSRAPRCARPGTGRALPGSTTCTRRGCARPRRRSRTQWCDGPGSRRRR